jgi:hypothetical protein
MSRTTLHRKLPAILDIARQSQMGQASTAPATPDSEFVTAPVPNGTAAGTAAEANNENQ